MPPPPQPGSPEWYLKKLHDELAARKSMYRLYSDYYEGQHKLAFATDKFREAFGNLFRAFADNWCDLVVDACNERMHVEGFRFPNEGEAGGEAKDDTFSGDNEAWQIWQENNLDAGSEIVHTESLINGCSYALVNPFVDDNGIPEITPESPEQMIVAYRSGTRRRVAALKEWWDEESGRIFATLYTPDDIFKWQSTRKVRNASDIGSAPNIRWVRRTGLPDGEEWPLAHDLGLVPVVAFENKPRMLRGGVSEIKKVIPIQDAINKLCADMLIASEFQSFRQRYLTGNEIAVDPVTNKPIPPFDHGEGRLWMLENPDAKFGEFSQAELTPFVTAIEMYVQHVASQSRTPPHYFYLKGQFPSGESIKSAETGLVAKSLSKMRHLGESWEEVIRVAFKAKRDPRATVMNSETIWADPESRSESEHIDSVVKKGAIGVPVQQLWEDAGYSPQQINKFMEMHKAAIPIVASLDVSRTRQKPAAGQDQPQDQGGGYS
jgi:hypothetical protein